MSSCVCNTRPTAAYVARDEQQFNESLSCCVPLQYNAPSTCTSRRQTPRILVTTPLSKVVQFVVALHGGSEARTLIAIFPQLVVVDVQFTLVNDLHGSFGSGIALQRFRCTGEIDTNVSSLGQGIWKIKMTAPSQVKP